MSSPAGSWRSAKASLALPGESTVGAPVEGAARGPDTTWHEGTEHPAPLTPWVASSLLASSESPGTAAVPLEAIAWTSWEVSGAAG